MSSAYYRQFTAAALLFFGQFTSGINATTITTPPIAASTTLSQENLTGTCESRTINYITDSLPQLCLLSSWSNTNSVVYSAPTLSDSYVSWQETTSYVTSFLSNDTPTAADVTVSDITTVQTIDTSASTDSGSSEPTRTATLTDSELEFNEAPFLSFEEWKKQTLEKAGQSNVNIGNRGGSGNKEARRRDGDSIQNSFDSLGDENELDIDFGVFRGAVDSTSLPQESKLAESGNSREIQDQEEQKQYNGQHRSKDAGRTCKERFSYASFDAGATVIKTHPGAKNPKAVLIENKDSYMLSECSAEDKFIIIELSEDIWMDTLVLANYEFFSSMIRTFRVSVSDRYPVKPDKWRDLGTYEARNSREIQAFLIENPQIWARYLKIEFLSHYGNEYYCPLSLIRVHGTRMLESWKEAEAGMDEEDTDNIDADNNTPENEESYEQSVDPISTTSSTTSDAVASTSIIENVINTTTSPSIDESLNLWTNSSIHIPLLMDKYYGLPICSPMSSAGVGTSTGTLGSEHIEIPMGTPSEYHTVVGSKSSSTVEVESSAPVSNTVPPQNSQPTTTVNHESVSSNTDAENPNKSTSDIDETAPTSSSITNTKIQEGSSSHKAKSSSTSSSSASLPTVQESFFKAVSRRLQLLEANSTLSLKYIEEQSRILREAFNKVEKKQLQKTTTFLETLNNTVLAELQGFRQQYDEIWQATVISLDTQRAESQREILAISARLNILADEVVFQKRMSIVQSVLLLLCLGLVIFSRVSSTSHFEFYTSRNRGFRGSINFGEDSPSSPESVKYSSYRDRKHWFQAEHSRQHLDESPLRSDSIDQRPLTPISTYSGSERGESPTMMDRSSSGIKITVCSDPSDQADGPYGLGRSEEFPDWRETGGRANVEILEHPTEITIASRYRTGQNGDTVMEGQNDNYDKPSLTSSHPPHKILGTKPLPALPSDSS